MSEQPTTNIKPPDRNKNLQHVFCFFLRVRQSPCTTAPLSEGHSLVRLAGIIMSLLCDIALIPSVQDSCTWRLPYSSESEKSRNHAIGIVIDYFNLVVMSVVGCSDNDIVDLN